MIDLNLLFDNGNSKYYFRKILQTFKYIEDNELGKLKEFIKLDFKFYCATDNSKKLNSNIKILDLNDYSIPIGKYGGQRQGKIFTIGRRRSKGS